MDGGRLATRSSARKRASAAQQTAANTTTTHTVNTPTKGLGQLSDFESLMDTATDASQIHELFNVTSRVHFEDAEDDDIPSMLMATASGASDDKYANHASNADSVLRMGFGNLNLISSQGNGGHDVVPLYSASTATDGSQHMSSATSANALLSFSGTSADLRAAIVSSWLTDHYEPQDNISLPRSVLYDHYLEYCQAQNTEPVNSATFGKIIRSVFPTLRTRRLGTRGNSKYHYFGIGLKNDFLGDDNYQAIYSQYSRPPPARPRTSRRASASTGGSAGGEHDLTAYGYGAFAPYTQVTASSHVYGASSTTSSSMGKQHLSYDDTFGSFQLAPAPKKTNSIASTNIQQQQQQQNKGVKRRSTRSDHHHHNHHQDYLDDASGDYVINNANNQAPTSASTNGAFRTNTSPNYDDFAHFLEQICTPVLSNVPVHIPFDNVAAFSLVYQQHIIDLLRAISSHEFGVVEGLSEMFWINFPEEMLTCLACEESLRIVAIADDYLYQVLIHTLIPDVLEPVPIAVTQSIRQFAKFLEGILQRTLQAPIPAAIIEVKLDAARRFCQVLRRRTSLSHLTQAVRSILGNVEHTAQMLSDWAHIDFASIQEQADWIVRAKDGILPWIEATFRSYLQEGVSLHVWAAWIETISEQCINSELQCSGNLEQACSLVTMRWSFYSAMMMRDLTLRSAASFGSFHLVNLLFSEYLLFLVEKRIDEHRRSVGLAAYWPSETANNPNTATNTTTSNTNAGNNAPTSNNFAFDDFFRKSAVLGPTSSPLPAGKTNQAANNAQNSPSKAAQHLQYALATNTPLRNKENQQQDSVVEW